MWTPSLPCIFWSTIVIQMISVATIIAMQLSPHGRRRNLCQQVFFGLLMAHGAGHRVGGELRQRLVDDVWGDFIGYDGLRDAGPGRERHDERPLSDRTRVGNAPSAASRVVCLLISIAQASCVDPRATAARRSPQRSPAKSKKTYLSSLPDTETKYRAEKSDSRAAQGGTNRNSTACVFWTMRCSLLPRGPMNPQELVVELSCWPRNQASQLPAKLVVTDTSRLGLRVGS